MTNEEMQKIIDLHKLSCKLKKTLRTGWINWQVNEERVESVAEHIFGCCMLAVGIYSTKKLDIDINKVITMIMLHETEEIIIGDITMFDFKELQTKQQDGRQAVLSIFKDFPNSQHFLDIIEEFEANETKEAKFAKQCDKFEADLQARLYEGHYNIDKVQDRFFVDTRTIEAINNGYDTVSEQFLQNDYHIYENEFKELADYMAKVEKQEKSNYNIMKNRFGGENEIKKI